MKKYFFFLPFKLSVGSMLTVGRMPYKADMRSKSDLLQTITIVSTMVIKNYCPNPTKKGNWHCSILHTIVVFDEFLYLFLSKLRRREINSHTQLLWEVFMFIFIQEILKE